MIYINGRFITQKLTGVQRFAVQIIKSLISLRDDIVILVPDAKRDRAYDFIREDLIKVVKGGSGHYWEQFTLKSFLNKNGNPLLLSLCSTAPIFYENQIVTHHDITYVRHPDSFSWKFRLLYKFLIPRMLNSSKFIVTVSEFSKTEISAYYNIDRDKIIVVPNAVSDEFSLRDKNECFEHKPYALVVSSPNVHKNFHGLINAFVKTDLDINLKVIGESSGVFTKLNLDDTKDSRVQFLGRVNDLELVSLYKNALFFAFPSFYEGFGIPPLEAQACGCPVISSNKASMKEVLKNSCLYFNPYSQSEIRDALSKVSNDYVLRESLRNQGYENVKNFSWDESALKISKLINQAGL